MFILFAYNTRFGRSSLVHCLIITAIKIDSLKLSVKLLSSFDGKNLPHLHVFKQEVDFLKNLIGKLKSEMAYYKN